MYSRENNGQTLLELSDGDHKNSIKDRQNKALFVRLLMVLNVISMTSVGVYGCDDSDDDRNVMTAEVTDAQVSDHRSDSHLSDGGASADQGSAPTDALPTDMGDTAPQDAMMPVDMAEEPPPLDASMPIVDAGMPEPLDEALPEPEPTICGDEQERFQCLPACNFIRQCVFDHCDLSRQSDADLLGLHNQECVSSDCEAGQTAICDLPEACASLLDVASQIPHIRDLIRAGLCTFPTP